jgi:signal transduction histidine kinase
VAAVEWQAQEFQARTGVNCNCKLPAKEIDLDQGRSVAVFRIFQEILTNIARHANATSVEVSIKKQDGQLVLKVRDNGKGITKSEINNAHSLGLLGMRERALLLGGEVTFMCVERGSTIIVRIPMTDRRQSVREIG